MLSLAMQITFEQQWSPEKSPVPRSVTAPPRRLGRWPSSKSLTRMRSPTRIVVQTLPPARLQPLGSDTPKTPVTVARHYSQSQPLSATLPLQVVIAHERACKSPVRESHERAEPVRFISASGNVAAHERGRKNVGRETLGEHVETVRFISASGSHARELSLEKPARPAPPPQSVRQATYRATSSERQPKTPQMPCRTSQPRYQYSPQPRQTHQVIQPQQPQQPAQQPAQPLAQSPPRYQLLAHQQSPQPRVQYFNPASYAQTAPMVVPRLPGTNLTVLPPQTVVWPGQPRRE
ncbi:unnamed protein product [Symbiodinium natans]|uniref:Uncharacterized protein n=1 Tax=Symbiodinium natans TaxID=878477 RepID=A0A812G0Y3_9DINO|nr:unnamed protein product [Symbiodinium natans]